MFGFGKKPQVQSSRTDILVFIGIDAGVLSRMELKKRSQGKSEPAYSTDPDCLTFIEQVLQTVCKMKYCDLNPLKDELNLMFAFAVTICSDKTGLIHQLISQYDADDVGLRIHDYQIKQAKSLVEIAGANFIRGVK